MGGTLMREPYAQAVDTVARLQEAAGNGLPVLIPGALEGRARSVEDTHVIGAPVAAAARTAAVFDRVRLERGPEAGSAPSSRTAGGFRRMLARLWRRALRGPDAAPVVV
jgi:hypothetical protein